MAPLTTLGIGGPARFLAEAMTEDEVSKSVAFARSRGLPLLILGGGSNLLVSDEGFPGLVVRIRIPGVTFTDHGAGMRVRAGAGTEWDSLVADCVARGLCGIECLSGIPGQVGGTPVQNVGAYGQEVSDVIVSVRVHDRDEDRIRDLAPEDCGFGYRSSVFNTTAHGRYVVLAVEYQLARDRAPVVAYPDLANRFREREDFPSLEEVRQAVLAIRRTKAMLIVEGDPDARSAGSFFRNPVLSETGFARLSETAGGQSLPVPGYVSDGGVKVPAAWLIEQAGFPKGTTRGRVGLSRKHALALVNRGGATAREVLDLAASIQDAVEDRFGVLLRTEPAFVGFPDDVVERFGAVTG